MTEEIEQGDNREMSLKQLRPDSNINFLFRYGRSCNNKIDQLETDKENLKHQIQVLRDRLVNIRHEHAYELREKERRFMENKSRVRKQVKSDWQEKYNELSKKHVNLLEQYTNLQNTQGLSGRKKRRIFSDMLIEDFLTSKGLLIHFKAYAKERAENEFENFTPPK